MSKNLGGLQSRQHAKRCRHWRSDGDKRRGPDRRRGGPYLETFGPWVPGPGSVAKSKNRTFPGESYVYKDAPDEFPFGFTEYNHIPITIIILTWCLENLVDTFVILPNHRRAADSPHGHVRKPPAFSSQGLAANTDRKATSLGTRA